ncbi:MAG: hypothetical protein ACKPFF_27035 [Planktothrix sp.]
MKSKYHKQSIQYPQNVTINGEHLKVPKIGEIKAVFHREITETMIAIYRFKREISPPTFTTGDHGLEADSTALARHPFSAWKFLTISL